MSAIRPLGHGRPRGAMQPRVLFLLAVTIVTLGVMWWAGRDSGRTVAGAPSSRPGRSTTTSGVATPTSAYRFDIDPAWLPKSSSRYSDSANAKAERDELGGAAQTTTVPPPVEEVGASSSTTARATMSSTRPIGRTTTTVAATAPPATVTTATPSTAPPTTVAPDPSTTTTVAP